MLTPPSVVYNLLPSRITDKDAAAPRQQGDSPGAVTDPPSAPILIQRLTERGTGPEDMNMNIMVKFGLLMLCVLGKHLYYRKRARFKL